MDAGFFRGTSSEQDNRFSDKEKKLLKQMKFADSIAKKVDMSRVNLDVLKPWIANRISELLGMEDDVLNEFVFNQLEADNNPDGRRIQINLTGFLNGKNARVFMGELWDLLLDAMENAGIPTVILNAKKAEISQRTQQQEQNNMDGDKNKSRGSDSQYKNDDRKFHSSSRYPQDRDRNDRSSRNNNSSYQSHRSSQDDGKSRKRDQDYSDRDRDNRDNRDDRRSRDDSGRKRSRFSDLQPEPELVKSVDSDEIKKEKSPQEELPEKLPKHRADEEDFEKVEMKRRSKKSKHHRKRRRSSSSRDEESDDEKSKKSSRDKKKKKKKSSSSKRRDKSRSPSRSRSGSREQEVGETGSMEQELRVRALESMKKQKSKH